MEMNKHAEIVKSIDSFVGENLNLLMPVKESWQPSDLLPHLETNSWEEGIRELESPGRKHLKLMTKCKLKNTSNNRKWSFSGLSWEFELLRPSPLYVFTR